MCAVVTLAVAFDTSYTVSQTVHSCSVFVRNVLLENVPVMSTLSSSADICLAEL